MNNFKDCHQEIIDEKYNNTSKDEIKNIFNSKEPNNKESSVVSFDSEKKELSLNKNKITTSIAKKDNIDMLLLSNINDHKFYWENNKHVNRILLKMEPENNANTLANSFIYAVGIQPLLFIFMISVMAFLPTLAIFFNSDDAAFLASILLSTVLGYVLTKKLNGYLYYKIFSGEIIKEYKYSTNVLKHSEANTIASALNYYGTKEGYAINNGDEDDNIRANNIQVILNVLNDDVPRGINEAEDIKNRLIISIRNCDKEDILYNGQKIISENYVFRGSHLLEANSAPFKKRNLLLVKNNSNSSPLDVTMDSYSIYGSGEGRDEYYRTIFKKLAKMDNRLSNLYKIYISDAWLDFNNKAMDDFSDSFLIIVNELCDAYYIIGEARASGLSDGSAELLEFHNIVDIVMPQLDAIEGAIVAGYTDKLVNVKDKLQNNFSS